MLRIVVQLEDRAQFQHAREGLQDVFFSFTPGGSLKKSKLMNKTKTINYNIDIY